MTLLEEKFMKQMPGIMARIATALEGINEKLELLAQRTEQSAPEPEPEPEPEDDIDYDRLWGDIQSMRLGSWIAKRALNDALRYRMQYVNKLGATSLACYYGGVTVKQVKEAIGNGEIECIAPKMKDVQVSQWKDGKYVKVTRKQPVGKYQINLKSAVLWLESHGRRGVASGHPAYKCIEKIINS